MFLWTLLSITVCHVILPSRSLNVIVSSAEVWAYDPTFNFFTFSQDAEFHHLVVTAAKVDSSFYKSDLFFLVYKYGVQQKVCPSTAH